MHHARSLLLNMLEEGIILEFRVPRILHSEIVGPVYTGLIATVYYGGESAVLEVNAGG